jgi:hypothetical protein
MRQAQYIALLFEVFAAEGRSRGNICSAVEWRCTREMARLVLTKNENTVRFRREYGLLCKQFDCACGRIKI